MALECMGAVRIFPPPLHTVAPGEKSKRSGIYIYIYSRKLGFFGRRRGDRGRRGGTGGDTRTGGSNPEGQGDTLTGGSDLAKN